jgi:hypothetical protein
MKRDSKRFWLPMLVLGLAVLFALGGCARGINAGNSGNTQGNLPTTSSQTPGTTTTSSGGDISAELNRLQQLDNQNQTDNNSLNTDDQNANQNFGNDQETTPSASLAGGLNMAVTTPATSVAACTTVDCAQKFGDLRIQERITALEKLKLTAQNHTSLTDAQRNTIINDANSNESGLKDLKTRLDGETDLKAAAADVKSIYSQFRIYAVVLPRDYGEILLFHEQNIITRMNDAEPTIEDLIQQDQDAGHDVSKLNSLYQDYKNKLADATDNTNKAQGLIPSLTPANYPGTDQTLRTYHLDLKTARVDLKGAADDLHQMYQILKADLGSLKPTPTPAS